MYIDAFYVFDRSFLAQHVCHLKTNRHCELIVKILVPHHSSWCNINFKIFIIMANFWTLISSMLISLVIVNAQNYNYGHGNYYNPLAPQRSNEQHFKVIRVNSIPIDQQFVPQNQQYFPAANPNQLIGAQVYKGDYNSQSESAQLDQSAYPYKQRIPGDTRNFKRFVTTCYPGGRCENQSHDVNSVDKSHQDVLYQFRAQIQNYAKKEAQNAYTSVAPKENREYLPPAVPSQNQGYQAQQTQQILSTNPVFFAQPSQQSAQLTANSFERPPERRLYPYYKAVSSISFN